MGPLERLWIALAAVLGAIAVLAGAFAAHALSDPRAVELFRTGAQWAAVHVLACLLAVILGRLGLAVARIAAPVFLAGTLLFSGSLYALALGAPIWTAAFTPIGGLLFIAGWVILFVSAVSRSGPDLRA
ncbi:MAG: DUF423 domain-containing protein [Caulobacteraceae bacterium]